MLAAASESRTDLAIIYLNSLAKLESYRVKCPFLCLFYILGFWSTGLKRQTIKKSQIPLTKDFVLDLIQNDEELMDEAFEQTVLDVVPVRCTPHLTLFPSHLMFLR